MKFSLVLTIFFAGFSESQAQCPTAAGAIRSHTDISCFAAEDGSITVELLTGDAPITFQLYDLILDGTVIPGLGNSVVRTIDPTNFRRVTFSNVYASSFVVTVFKTGCTPFNISDGPSGFTIDEPAQLAITVNNIDPDCTPATGGANADGGINLSISGGRTPYNITWTSSATAIGNSSGNTNPFAVSVSNLDGGAYTINVTDASGCTVSQNIAVPISTVPDAGPDQVLCNSTTATLQATPVGPGEVGTWARISGTGTVTTPNDPNSGVTDLTIGAVSTFRWTITDAGGLCPGNSDQMTIQSDNSPTPADAGPDQTLCATSTNLAAVAPTVGTGAWTIVSGAGGTITTPSSATSQFTGVAGTTYELRWSTSNGSCPVSTNEVLITFDAPPTPANAGPDQTICGNSATLAGNVPSTGTGSWSIISGTGGSFANASSPVSGFNGTAGVTYVLQWQISNGTCTASSDQVTIQFDQAPSPAVAGADQTLCSTSATLGATAPAIGAGTWSIVNGAGGVIAAPNNPLSGFTGVAGTTYELQWSVVNGVCPAVIDNVLITFDANPTAANAGPDQTVCGPSATLAANTPSIGTGLWSIVSGTGGIIATPASPASGFTGVPGNTYVLRWTTSNGTCPTTQDDVQIRLDAAPSPANAGPDQNVCSATATLAANTPAVGTGIWTIVSGTGGTIANPLSPVSSFTGNRGTTYTLQWTVTNGVCPAEQDQVQIRIDQDPTPANAGADQVLCATTANLAGNAAAIGTGTWSIVSGTGGTFANPALANSGFTGTAGTTYVLQWSISNGSCAVSQDQVSIQFDAPPTVANAGPDQTLCNNTTTLAANAPGSGTGAWTIVSGIGGTIVTPSSPASVFNGTPGNVYVLRWTISNGTCTPSTDDVSIRFDAAPTIANAGPDQTVCNTGVTLNANTPTTGSGLWSVVSGTGGTFTVPSNPGSAFNGTPGTTYVLQWSISNGSCTPSSDQVTITLEALPTAANAGPDQALCNTTTTLAGNTPATGTGAWNIVSGAGGTLANAASPASSFTGTAGTTYVLQWTITNGSCPVSQDQVTITFDAQPTVATAGADQAICGTSATLDANTATVGTGLWSIVSGTGGVITNPSSPVSAFNGVAGNTYVLQWTISNGTCTPSQDQVTIRFDQAPSAANAGPDQTVCTTATALAAIAPAIGTGTWTIVSGTGGVIADAASPVSGFTGTGGTTYVLQWTVANGACTSTQDQVTINMDAQPTVANAGTDQTICGNAGTLAANTATIGTGLWTIVSGTGGVIADPASPVSGFTGTAGTTYTLQWTISNGSCTPSQDQVTIQLQAAPSAANAGADQTICNTTATLGATPPAVGTGLWTIVSGAGGAIADPASPVSSFTGTSGTTYVLQWTVTNGTCSPVNDQVTIVFETTPTPADAGADQTLCNTTATLSANTPVVGTGAWSVISGTGGAFANAGNPATTFTGTPGVTYTLRWTVSNGTCTPSTDDVQIIFDISATAAVAGPDQSVCSTSVTLAANTPVLGTGTWSVVSGTGGTIAAPANPGSGFAGIAGNTYVLRWSIVNGTCTSSDDVQITLEAPPTTAAAGPDKTVCGTTALEGNTPATGSGVWSIVSGSGGVISDPASPVSAFAGTGGTSYTLRWTISAGSCTASTDDVLITFDSNTPTPSDAGPDQNLCNTTTNLAGNTPTTGTGSWSIVSGAGGAIANASSPVSTFSGTAGATYVLRWTISTGVAGCAATTDDVSITFDSTPVVANAGPDAAVCGNTATLAGNAPSNGAGLWTIISGTGGSFVDPTNPLTVFNGTPGVAYELQWSISNSCGTSTDEIQLFLDQSADVAVAGNDQTVCGAATLSANTPVTGSGIWSIVNGAGGVVADPNSPSSAFTGTAGSTYTLRWTITNGACTPTFDDVDITFDPNTPSPAAAGADQDVCGTTATLAANIPAVGTGAWSIISGTGGVIADVANAASGFNGTAGQTYILQWTITSSCGTTSDQVSVSFSDLPTPAAAGNDKTVCGPTVLEGNVPATGTGTWSIVSGTGGIISDPSNPASPFSGTASTVYVLRWTISSGGCTASTDDVQITFDVNSPTIANAGADVAACTTSINLNGNTPITGTGLWTIVSGTGGVIANVTDPVSAFSGVAGNTYTLRWSITSATPGCSASVDEVAVSLEIPATVADAGADQQVCGNTVTLAGNTPVTGAGLWSVVSGTGGTFGDNSDPAGSFTGVPGETYILQWAISNSCGSTTDQVQVILDRVPTPATAGADKTICGPAALEGNTPSVGTGTWTIISGTGGVIGDPSDPSSVFSGVPGSTYTLRWTISNGTCADSFDEVAISIDVNSPTIADAGADQNVCTTTVNLAANNPVVGTGVWSIVSGTGGTITAPADRLSSFTGLSGQTYVLRWTISAGTAGCAASTDDVTIRFETAPTVPAAGIDQVACGTTVTLAANAPASGSGLWTIISGTGGTFADASVANTTFTGTAGQSYELEWTISNSCGSGADRVMIQLIPAPTTANAGTDQVLCGVITATLNANTPTVGTGIWTIVSGAGGAVLTPSSPTSQFVGSAGSIYTLRWIVTNASCTPSTDDVVINFSGSPAVTNPVTVCINNAASPLTAVASGATGFNWYYFTNPSNPATRTFLANTASGNYTPGAELNTTVIGSVTYEVTAVYACGESPASQIVVNVSNTGACGGGTGNCATVVITPIPSPATCTLSNGSVTFDIVPFTPAVNTTGVVIEIDGISVSNDNISRTNFNNPVFNGLPIGRYEYRITYGSATCVKEGLFTIDQSGTVGIPVATNIKGPVCAGTASGSVTIDVAGETGNVLEWSVDGLTWTSFVSGAPDGVTGVPSGPAPSFERLISVRRSASDPCNAAVMIVMQDVNSPVTFSITNRTNITECFAEDGSFRVSSIAGGVGPYQARLLVGSNIIRDFEPATGNEITFNNLASGTYTVEIRDANNCIFNNVADPVTLTAPGAVRFTTQVIAGGVCETRQGRSGLVYINFDLTERSGNYRIGISTNPVIEPERYVTYVYNQGDATPIAIDTLSRGEYYVFIKPAAGNVCPSVRPTGFVDGPFQINFDIQRVCNLTNDGSATVNLMNVSGDPAAFFNIEVYRLSNLAEKVDDFTDTPDNGIIDIRYSPASPEHTWLAQPDEYLIRVYQMNQSACPGNRPLQTPYRDRTYQVTQPLAVVVENIRASYPEPKQTGGFLLRTVTGGVPLNDGDGPYYLVSVYDASNNAQLFGPLKVGRNPQGNYQYNFRNLPVGNYQVIVTDLLGCESGYLAIVPADTRILIPNIFTPNNDNINDRFEIVNLPAGGKHEIVISNRWGKQVFSSDNYQEGSFWDADGAPEGIYFYRIKIEGDKTYTGWVEIVRGSKP